MLRVELHARLVAPGRCVVVTVNKRLTLRYGASRPRGGLPALLPPPARPWRPGRWTPAAGPAASPWPMKAPCRPAPRSAEPRYSGGSRGPSSASASGCCPAGSLGLPWALEKSSNPI